jgi:NADH-quinone oxidoreductase subunit N
MLSLAGLPPLAGFWGKLALFGSSLAVATADTPTGLRGPYLVLAVVAALNAAIGAAYYLRIIAAMFFQPAIGVEPPARGGVSAALATALCAVLVIVCAAPGWAVRLAQEAETALHDSPSKLAGTDLPLPTIKPAADTLPLASAPNSR